MNTVDEIAPSKGIELKIICKNGLIKKLLS